jgi:transcription elongation factor Elf1
MQDGNWKKLKQYDAESPELISSDTPEYMKCPDCSCELFREVKPTPDGTVVECKKCGNFLLRRKVEIILG